MAEVVAVAIGSQATDDFGAGWGVNGLALVADGDFTVVADGDAGLLAPDVGPPRALGRGSEDGALAGEGLLVGGVRGLGEFAVDFVLVGVGGERVEQLVGVGEFNDAFCGEEGDEAFLPVVVAAFDFAVGLRGWGVAELDAVAAECRAELGEGIGVVSVEEAVVVHIEGQRQAVSLEDAGEEVEVGEEGFRGIEAGAGVEAGGVVEDFQEDLFVGAAVEEGVGCGVVLPEGAVVAGLPAFDGFGWSFVAGVGVEFVCDGPTTDAGTVGFEMETAVEFAGDGAVGGGWLGGQKFGGQSYRFHGPGGMMISAGETGGPGVGLALGTGAEIIGVKFLEAGMSQSQFGGRTDATEVSGAEVVEDVTDEWSGQTMDDLKFFMTARVTEGVGFIALRLMPAGLAGLAQGPARPAVYQASDGARVASPQSPILR
jgi:hypothetical protein